MTSCVAGIAAAGYSSSSHGTTGHYGNQFGHGGFQDHSHQDHIYGYDSVPAQKYLKESFGGDGFDDNEAAANEFIDNIIDLANTERKDDLKHEFEKHEQRINEIAAMREFEIKAPFDYQLTLLEQEDEDLGIAYGEVELDRDEAWLDMTNRLEELREDTVAALDREVVEIENALWRAVADHKNPCKVLMAIRLDIVKDIGC